MKQRILSASAILIFALPCSYALDLQMYMWTKQTVCSGSGCLPQVISHAKAFSIQEPHMDESTNAQISFDEYQGSLKWMKRSDFGGYHIFQTEIFKDGQLVALCSRYEALDTVEAAPVGACAGLAPHSDFLIGATIIR